MLGVYCIFDAGVHFTPNATYSEYTTSNNTISIITDTHTKNVLYQLPAKWYPLLHHNRENTCIACVYRHIEGREEIDTCWQCKGKTTPHTIHSLTYFNWQIAQNWHTFNHILFSVVLDLQFSVYYGLLSWIMVLLCYFWAITTNILYLWRSSSPRVVMSMLYTLCRKIHYAEAN